MKKSILNLVLFSLLFFSDRYILMHPDDYGECTIGVFAGWATADGRPMLWKNRDVTNDIQKFCYFEPRLPHADTAFYSFIGNVYSWDTTRVYMGINEAGFGIINSNCYNLGDSLSIGIDDGELLRLALERCKDVEEFEDFLAYTALKGRLDCWNIGIIDADGGAMLYECSNYSYRKYDANNIEHAPDGIIIRTTFALSGGSNRPSINRYKRAYNLAHKREGENPIDVEFVLQTLSRDLFNPMADPYPLPYIGQQNGRPPGFIFSHDLTINRDKTRSVMLLRGVRQGEDPRLSTAFCTIGPPVLSVAFPLWVYARTIPSQLNIGQEVPMFSRVLQHRANLYPLSKEPYYLNSHYLKNNNGTGIYESTLPLEDNVIFRADSCIEAWNQEFPSREEMLASQQNIANYIYFNYLQIPLIMTGTEDLPIDLQQPEISCFPNPFNARTTIHLNGFQQGSDFSVKIYDLLGREIRTFIQSREKESFIVWNGKDNQGAQVSSGVYLVRVESLEYSKTVKALLIK